MSPGVGSSGSQAGRQDLAWAGVMGGCGSSPRHCAQQVAHPGRAACPGRQHVPPMLHQPTSASTAQRGATHQHLKCERERWLGQARAVHQSDGRRPVAVAVKDSGDDAAWAGNQEMRGGTLILLSSMAAAACLVRQACKSKRRACAVGRAPAHSTAHQGLHRRTLPPHHAALRRIQRALHNGWHASTKCVPKAAVM